MNEDRELLNELVLESRDHLAGIEPDLLVIEKDPGAASEEMINKIFRAVHSIKGGFSFFGLQPVISLSHAMENALSRVRDKKIGLSGPLVDALLNGVDKLRIMIDDVDHVDVVPFVEEMKSIEPFLTDSAAAANAARSPAPRDGSRFPNFSEETRSALQGGSKTVYEITITGAQAAAASSSPRELLERWKKVGELLDGMVECASLDGIEGIPSCNPVYHFLFASVLEPDLIATGLAISPQYLRTVDLGTPEQTGTTQQSVTLPKGREPADTAAVSRGHAESKAEDAVRVRVNLLNTLMDLAGELVLGRNQLISALSRRFTEGAEAEKVVSRIAARVAASTETLQTGGGALSRERIDAELSRLRKDLEGMFAFRLLEVHGINSIVQNLDLVTSMIQENIMLTRMQPMSVVVGKFPRLIRDLAKKLGKEINLVTIGQEVEVDKSIVELLSDPLTHLVRNSADHGIENPDDRERAGKSRQGQVVLRAFHEGGKVNIEISDDGAGIDPARIKSKAIEKGLLTDEAAARMTDRELQALIFMPGFSTAEVVSDVSGRGVGMDVVKTNIERMGGTIEIESEVGAGSSIILRLPLTLAIIPSLIVATGGRRFAIPQMSIEEIVRIRSGDVTRKIERIKGSEVLRLRGRLLPLVRLTTVLKLRPTFVDPETGEAQPDRRDRWSDRRRGEDQSTEDQPTQGESGNGQRTGKADRRTSVANAVKVLVLRHDKNLYGLIVDEVLDNEEIVVKPLSEYLKSCQCYAGATIMGDGKVAMILDANGIAQLAELKFAELAEDAAKEKLRLAQEALRRASDLLLFSNGTPERFALALNDVARIEKRRPEEIETVGGKLYLKNETATLRLVRVHDYLPVTAPRDASSHCYVIIPKKLKRPLGILVSQVEDVVATDLHADLDTITGTGIAGSIVINRSLVILVDIPGLFRAAEPDADALN